MEKDPIFRIDKVKDSVLVSLGGAGIAIIGAIVENKGVEVGSAILVLGGLSLIFASAKKE